MDNLEVVRLRKILLGFVGFVLIITIAACGMSDLEAFLPEPSPTNDEFLAPTGSPVPTTQELPSATMAPTLTITPSPTESGLVPLKTQKPTLRPSWTVVPKTARPTWTASPTLSPTVTPEVGIMLQEDFNSKEPYAPWMKRAGGNWNTGIARKMYFMTVSAPKVEITSSRTWLKPNEVRLEADLIHNNGNGYYGFHCRETPAGNYYTIFITTDGYYGFGENRNDVLEYIKYAPLPVLDPPIDPKGENHLRADCRGNALTLYVNGEAIDRVTVVGLNYGYTGMMIGTRVDDNRLTVFYDNLVIWGAIQTEDEE